MHRTVVGCFDSQSQAQQVKQELIAAGIDSDRISLSGQQQSGSSSRSESDPGFWDSLKEAFGFADSEEDRYTYSEATRRGCSMVRVDVEESLVDDAVRVMERHNVVNLDQRGAQWRQQGWQGYDAHRGQRAAAQTVNQGQEAIPVVEEELQVGKREVQRGGVRVYSRVTERPIEEQVQLREEHVRVERRPVDRPISDADYAFQEKVIEATETAEQAVVSKQARVVEEVVVNKEVEQRAQTVRDTVRRTDVEVQKIGPDATSTSGARGADYSFADELLSDQRYHGRQWSEVESDFRSHYERRNPGSKWDQVRDTIRDRFDRARSGSR